MTNFVNSSVLLAGQIALPVDGILLEEVADFITRRKEVVVPDMVIVPGGEFGLMKGWSAGCVMRIW
jgi:hypothetical protein